MDHASFTATRIGTVQFADEPAGPNFWARFSSNVVPLRYARKFFLVQAVSVPAIVLTIHN